MWAAQRAWTSTASCRAPSAILLGVLLLSWSLASCWVVFLWGQSQGCIQVRRCCCYESKAVQLSFSIWCVHIFLSCRDGKGLLESCLQRVALCSWQMELFHRLVALNSVKVTFSSSCPEVRLCSSSSPWKYGTQSCWSSVSS